MRRHTALLALTVLAGCAVGPDYQRPAIDGGDRYRRDGAPVTADGTVAADWWRAFASPQLDALMGQALADNLTLAAAKSRLQAMQQLAAASAGALLPQADLSGGVSRERVNFVTFGMQGHSPIFNLFSIGPSISYALDVWGGTRRQVEADSARAEGDFYRLGAATLMIAGNVVVQATTAAAADAGVAAATAAIADDRELLDLLRRGESAGITAHGEVVAAEAQLAEDRSALPPLRQAREAARNALALLTGNLPSRWSPPTIDLDALTIPKTMPLSLPSELIARRPDILAAEADLRAASAGIGVATANLLPHIELSAAISRAAVSPTLFWQGSATQGAVGAGITAPLFHGGALWAERNAAEAAYQASLADYRQTVLAAFAQVGDVLQANDDNEELLAAATDALRAAEQGLAMSRAGLASGMQEKRALLTADRRRQWAQAALARTEARRVVAIAQLYVALGGGWTPTNDR